MRYPAAEKLETIRLVEQSHLPVRRTLATPDAPEPPFSRDLNRLSLSDDGHTTPQGVPCPEQNRRDRRGRTSHSIGA